MSTTAGKPLPSHVEFDLTTCKRQILRFKGSHFQSAQSSLLFFFRGSISASNSKMDNEIRLLSLSLEDLPSYLIIFLSKSFVFDAALRKIADLS